MRRRCFEGQLPSPKPSNRKLKERKTLKCKRPSDRAKRYREITKTASVSSSLKKRSKCRLRWTSTDRRLSKRGRRRRLHGHKPWPKSKRSCKINKMQWRGRWPRVTSKSEKRSSKKNRKLKESSRRRKRPSGLRCSKDCANKLVLRMSVSSSSRKPKKRRSCRERPQLSSLRIKTRALAPLVSDLSPTWLRSQSRPPWAIQQVNGAQLRK